MGTGFYEGGFMCADDIVKKYLEENGYAGLRSSENDCSCRLGEDFADCDYFSRYCEPMKADGTYAEEEV
jgi:hypothetical protein